MQIEFNGRKYFSFGYFLTFAPIRDLIQRRDELKEELNQKVLAGEEFDRLDYVNQISMIEGQLWVYNCQNKTNKARAAAA